MIGTVAFILTMILSFAALKSIENQWKVLRSDVSKQQYDSGIGYGGVISAAMHTEEIRNNNDTRLYVDLEKVHSTSLQSIITGKILS